MTGKQKCRILKEIRRQIAVQNDIRYVVEECTHKGNCRGTCPKCEWEVRMLEKELEKRRNSGKKVVLAGISAGFLLTSCSPIDTVKEIISEVSNPLEGDIMAQTSEGAIAETDQPECMVTEGEPAWEYGTESGEVMPEEIVEFAGILPAEDETDMPIPGEVLPVYEEEETILEGDVAFVGTEDGDAS